MARGTFVYRNGELVPKAIAMPLFERGPRNDLLPLPYVSLDTMDPMRSMLDGKLYDSKASLRATYKAAGVREIGNQCEDAVKDAYARMPSKPPVKPELIEAYKMVAHQGYKPAPLEVPNDPDLD